MQVNFYADNLDLDVVIFLDVVGLFDIVGFAVVDFFDVIVFLDGVIYFARVVGSESDGKHSQVVEVVQVFVTDEDTLRVEEYFVDDTAVEDFDFIVVSVLLVDFQYVEVNSFCDVLIHFVLEAVAVVLDFVKLGDAVSVLDEIAEFNHVDDFVSLKVAVDEDFDYRHLEIIQIVDVLHFIYLWLATESIFFFVDFHI